MNRDVLILLPFLATTTTAVAFVGLGEYLWRYPRTRLVPGGLKHRWSFGMLTVLMLAVFFVLPFVLVGEYRVAVVASVLTVAVLPTAARQLVREIVDDLREHRRDRRGLFEHAHGCVAREPHGPSRPQAT